MKEIEEKRKKHAKRNIAISLCEALDLTWEADDDTIYIKEMGETFTHEQTDELIRRLRSLEPFYY